MIYTFAAKPTLYKSRLYRSRLEARWAAFFDLVQWNVEYEPCDLGGWSPDFAIWGQNRDCPTLVEVKPIREWDRETARKMADAAGDLPSDVLLLGESPILEDDTAFLGWFGNPGVFEYAWEEVYIGQNCLDQYDFITHTARSHELLSTVLWGTQGGLRTSPEVPALWRTAANLVQWKGALHHA